ncbi:SipW-dependent-type signal peptide-containing protein [Eubacterium sp. 1001713B170207_170306_E7]|uniref:SipW-dependent-type signal peptide-containing protein n=1 Tax=Eubacterium sp. 1001713B170207_170306_E7 TaxID=2787097 RepID=UPI001897EDF5|nr:SipW-dependent-type signal peptide-containing protein [Eubacterium sp. 1001713B170207_170306_E7]
MTKKKKGALLISAFALIALLVVGGTLAYFTSQDSADNVFTLGKVSGDLTETTKSGEEPVDPSNPEGPKHPVKPGTQTEEGGDITYDKVLPGDWLSKEPRVSIKANSEDAYVRVKLEVINEDGKLSPEQKDMLITDECLNFGENWVVSGEYVYYQEKLTSDPSGSSQTEPVFTVVKIPGDGWGNESAEAKFTIKITADLIQADNFSPVMTGDKITGWGDVNIEAE